MKIWSQTYYLRAWQFAAEAHQGQTVPGTALPYIVHIASVAMEVMTAISQSEVERDADLAVQCALLHDTLEDTSISRTQLADVFGEAVTAGVTALSKNPDIPDKRSRMRDSLTRIRQQSQEIWMVKLADRITNLQPPPAHWNADKIQNYRDEASEILISLGEADDYLATRLQEKITQYPDNA
ncbi:MAG: HD domain-containing protein [Pseudomonadota bacterium]